MAAGEQFYTEAHEKWTLLVYAADGVTPERSYDGWITTDKPDDALTTERFVPDALDHDIPVTNDVVEGGTLEMTRAYPVGGGRVERELRARRGRQVAVNGRVERKGVAEAESAGGYTGLLVKASRSNKDRSSSSPMMLTVTVETAGGIR